MSIEELDKLGIEYTRNLTYEAPPPEHTRTEGPWVTSVRLPLLPEEWCQLCTDDGEWYQGGCCAQLSYFQDSLNSWFRRSGQVSTGELVSTLESVYSHEGLEMFNEERWKEGQGHPLTWTLSPLYKVAVVYHAVKDVATPDFDDRNIRGTDLGSPEACTRALFNAAYVLDTHLLYTHFGCTAENKAQTDANTLVRTHRFYVPLLRVHELLTTNPPPSMDAYAVVDHKGECTVNGRGLVLLETEQKANEMLEFWKRDAPQGVLESLNKMRVRPCRVSVTDGIQWLDDEDA